MILKRIAFIAAMVTLLLFGILGPASAEDGDTFFKGKVVRIVVGIPPGGANDVNARILAKYMPKYIPGHPTIIVQNQAGAAGAVMTNALYANGPFDGLTIGAGLSSIATAQLLQPAGVRYDARKLIWLGASDQEVHVTYIWNTSPVKTIQDAQHTQLIVGAQGPGTSQWDYPTLANALLGTKFKIISGYDSMAALHAAMERGEVAGNGSSSYVTLATMSPEWLTDKKVNIILQWGYRDSPALAGVPRAYDLAQSDADRAAIKLVQVRLLFGKPLFLPPGVPADRVAVLRKAFDDTMKDPGFIEDEAKVRLDVFPMTGDEVTKAVEDAYATPPAVIERVRNILAGKGS